MECEPASKSQEDDDKESFSHHFDVLTASRRVSGQLKTFVRESFIQTLEKILRRALLSRNLIKDDDESSIGDSTTNSLESVTRMSEEYLKIESCINQEEQLFSMHVAVSSSRIIEGGSQREYNRCKKICCAIS